MKKIDDELGGTTPLNIILKFPTSKEESKKDNSDELDEWEEENKDK